MQKTKHKLMTESNANDWNLVIENSDDILAGSIDGYVFKAVCPNQTIADEVTSYLVTEQLEDIVEVRVA